jgi:hypothetical protein
MSELDPDYYNMQKESDALHKQGYEAKIGKDISVRPHEEISSGTKFSKSNRLGFHSIEFDLSECRERRRVFYLDKLV